MDRTTLKQHATLSARLNGAFLRLMGWKMVGQKPDLNKYLIVGAPHTSNLDFILFLMITNALDIRSYWIGKDSLFKGFLGKVLIHLRGIPVNRRVRNGFVQQIIDTYAEHEELVIAISPEGTRKRTNIWKTGFYYIALGAQIPIVLAFLDSSRRELGLGPTLIPTGNLEADFEIIRDFYSVKTGLYPASQGLVQIKEAA